MTRNMQTTAMADAERMARNILYVIPIFISCPWRSEKFIVPWVSFANYYINLQ
jgi:hypothetical protein